MMICGACVGRRGGVVEWWGVMGGWSGREGGTSVEWEGRKDCSGREEEPVVWSEKQEGYC